MSKEFNTTKLLFGMFWTALPDDQVTKFSSDTNTDDNTTALDVVNKACNDCGTKTRSKQLSDILESAFLLLAVRLPNGQFPFENCQHPEIRACLEWLAHYAMYLIELKIGTNVDRSDLLAVTGKTNIDISKFINLQSSPHFAFANVLSWIGKCPVNSA